MQKDKKYTRYLVYGVLTPFSLYLNIILCNNNNNPIYKENMSVLAISRRVGVLQTRKPFF